MITNTGKGILTKYLLGQTSSYASHIAIGCGATPISTTPGNYSAKTSLDFEMLRIPIVSRGYVIENGIQQIVFTGEMPSDSRYEISEVGIYPASANPSAPVSDSKTLFTFDQNSSENWLESNATEIPLIYTLDSVDGTITPKLDGSSSEYTGKVFRSNATNVVFENVNRLTNFNNETPRFLDSALFIAGNAAGLPYSSDTAVKDATATGVYISYNTSVNLKSYGPNDKIKIAMSVMNKSSSAASPEYVSIQIRFKTADSANYAVLGKVLAAGAAWNPDTTRYIVIEEEIQNIKKVGSFLWDNVTSVEISTAVFEGTSTSGNYYAVLDAIRVENVSSISPVYGLVGYSVIKNTDAVTINKKANASTLIEFRFAVDVQQVV
jgi:hypothetical protein